MALVSVETTDGMIGWGEAKAAVGSAGSCRSVVAAVNHELAPELVGLDPRQINRAWDIGYNGSRASHAIDRGRAFPVLGRRGTTISALSGVDMALWDLGGKLLGAPVVDLWGGPRQATMPMYASGGWASEEKIGEQLLSYVASGFGAVKMRVGVMDGSVAASVARVRAAREALGPDIGLMVDAHGTFSSPEAIRFAARVDDCDLSWFEEPVNSDNPEGTARVRASTSIPIAAGESESTRFDVRDLISHRAIDVVQPDLAICGGPSEARRIAALAESHQLELAPHCWGSALSFRAGVSLAFASSAATIIEYSLGANPLLHDLVDETHEHNHGRIAAPTGAGFGLTINQDFVREYSVADR